MRLLSKPKRQTSRKAKKKDAKTRACNEKVSDENKSERDVKQTDYPHDWGVRQRFVDREYNKKSEYTYKLRKNCLRCGKSFFAKDGVKYCTRCMKWHIRHVKSNLKLKQRIPMQESKEDFRANWGRRLFNAIKREGLVIDDIAKLTGFSYQTIRQYTLGRRQPCLYDFARLCKILEVNSDYLLFGKEKEDIGDTEDGKS